MSAATSARPDRITRTARDGAIALIAGAILMITLTFPPTQLAPLSLLALATLTFGVLGFCDEMGQSKMLVRAGLIAFILAIFARCSALMGVQSADIGRYYILYAFAAPIAIQLWSLAFLHRQQSLKILGALGTATSLAPIILLIAGHIVVGAGAFWGLAVLFEDGSSPELVRTSAVSKIDFMLAAWCICAGIVLLAGLVRSDT